MIHEGSSAAVLTKSSSNAVVHDIKDCYDFAILRITIVGKSVTLKYLRDLTVSGDISGVVEKDKKYEFNKRREDKSFTIAAGTTVVTVTAVMGSWSTSLPITL